MPTDSYPKHSSEWSQVTNGTTSRKTQRVQPTAHKKYRTNRHTNQEVEPLSHHLDTRQPPYQWRKTLSGQLKNPGSDRGTTGTLSSGWAFISSQQRFFLFDRDSPFFRSSEKGSTRHPSKQPGRRGHLVAWHEINAAPMSGLGYWVSKTGDPWWRKMWLAQDIQFNLPIQPEASKTRTTPGDEICH